MKTFKYLLLGSLFLASCGETDEVIQSSTGNGTTVAVTKELTISVLPMQSIGGVPTRSGDTNPEAGGAIGITYGENPSTRAQAGEAMNAAESKINNAYVLQFDGTASSNMLVSVKQLTAAELTGNTPITCQFKMAEGGQNRVYVAANLPDALVSAISNNATDPISLATFNKLVRFRTSETLPVSGLPMSAMQDIGVGGSFDLFQLKSALAKLKFTCATAGAVLTLDGVPNGYSFYQAEASDNAYRPSDMSYDSRAVDMISGTTYYVPANLAGRNNQLVQTITRCPYFAPKNSMFVKIAAKGTTYYVYLGDGSASDFNVASGYSYSVNATLYGTDSGDLRVGNPSFTDLDVNGTANCYIAPAADTWYTFNSTVMGNGATTPANGAANAADITPSKLNTASATVLWESLNTAVAPAKGSVVNNSLYVMNGRVYFKTGSNLGNAVIAAKDASGTIIWSWHIWRTATTPVGVTLNAITSTDGTFTAPTLKIMDRSLGALRATPNSNVTQEQDYGLYYQWGRKDPFQTQGGVTTAGGGSVANAVKNPATYYAVSGDWAARNDNLWGCPMTEEVTINTKKFNKNEGSKTIYDPCPVGWRVMPDYTFANVTKENSPWDATNKGRDLAQITTASVTPFFLAASGARNSGGGLGSTGIVGSYWTSSPYATQSVYGSIFYFVYDSTSPMNRSRADGNIVRCVQM